MKRWIPAVFLCLFAFAGCSTQSKMPAPGNSAASVPANPELAWKQRQADFARMASWRLQGRVGIQFRDQSASFGLSWLQKSQDQYEMNIKNPLTGAVMAYLKGTATDVTLQTNGKTYRDANAERLLQGQMGVSLPLSGMKYWVRGIPSPDAPVEAVTLDRIGRPEMLQQSGWQVEYTGWEGDGINALPKKVNLSRAAEKTRVKVIAKDWQTRY